MKKLILLLAFFGTFALTVNAQTANAVVEEVVEMTAADKAAAADDEITSEVCAHSGTVSYYKTATDKAGEVSKSKVSFDAATGSFVSAKATGCSKGAKKASCSKKEKASCSKKAKKKACCSGKKKSSCSKKTK